MSGDPVVSTMIATIFAVAGVLTLAPTLQRIFSALPGAQAVRVQAYRGMADPREIEATDTLGWIDLISNPPYTPWISAYFINNGPDAVEIGINYPDNRFVMNPGETITVDRSWAQERIGVIFFICAKGERASIRVIGEY